jgi:hypothetical protein
VVKMRWLNALQTDHHETSARRRRLSLNPPSDARWRLKSTRMIMSLTS